MSPAAPIGIVVANHNYARFLGAAIDSALAQELEPKPRVVVVDDGSTDESRAVIAARAGRIEAIFQEQRGQRAACIAGWRRLATPIVIFLDSDDLLHPHACATVLRHWRPGLVKLQGRMAVIDAAGRPTGVVFPKYPPSPTTEWFRAELLRRGDYPAPPTSGNAYAAALVERVADGGDLPFVDTLLNTAAPLFGEIATIEAVLASYRVHDRNWWMAARLDPAQLARRLALEEAKVRWLARFAAEYGLTLEPERLLAASPAYQEHRLALARLAPEGGGRLRATAGFVRALLATSDRPARKATRLAWALVAGLGPDAVARAALTQRLVPVARAPLLEWLLRHGARSA